MVVKCGHCRVYHHSIADVKVCSNRYYAKRGKPVANINDKLIPDNILVHLKKGYYAMRGSDDEPLHFYRVRMPQTGKWAGYIKIASQHGDMFREVAQINPDGDQLWIRRDRTTVSELMMVCINPNDAAFLYGQEIGRCCNCGKQLTDERSRWYGIGPDCEGVRPDIIAYVNEFKGVYAA